MEFVTESAEETRQLGEQLGHLLQPGDFVALQGDLGAGKTQFAQGVARGLAVPAEYTVTSPTYALMNIFPGRLPLYHFDLYRLGGAHEVEELGFDEYFYGCGVCLVEWAERLGQDTPATLLSATFSHEGDDRRRIRIEARGVRAEALLRQLAAGEKPFDPSAKSC